MFDILTFYHTDLAGNCSRPAEGYGSYRHGAGSSARMMSPEHGYQLEMEAMFCLLTTAPVLEE